MKPKEKAEHLLNHFLMITNKDRAKQAAQFVVKEILETIDEPYYPLDPNIPSWRYWNGVKAEIEKL